MPLAPPGKPINYARGNFKKIEHASSFRNYADRMSTLSTLNTYQEYLMIMKFVFVFFFQNDNTQIPALKKFNFFEKFKTQSNRRKRTGKL